MDARPTRVPSLLALCLDALTRSPPSSPIKGSSSSAGIFWGGDAPTDAVAISPLPAGRSSRKAIRRLRWWNALRRGVDTPRRLRIFIAIGSPAAGKFPWRLAPASSGACARCSTLDLSVHTITRRRPRRADDPAAARAVTPRLLSRIKRMRRTPFAQCQITYPAPRRPASARGAAPPLYRGAHARRRRRRQRNCRRCLTYDLGAFERELRWSECPMLIGSRAVASLPQGPGAARRACSRRSARSDAARRALLSSTLICVDAMRQGCVAPSSFPAPDPTRCVTFASTARIGELSQPIPCSQHPDSGNATPQPQQPHAPLSESGCPEPTAHSSVDSPRPLLPASLPSTAHRLSPHSDVL